MRKKLLCSLIGTLAASILSLYIVVSEAPAQSLSEIRSAIKSTGAGWVAGENPISRLSLQEKKRLLGVVNGPKPATHQAPTCQSSTVGLPPSIDWRNNGGNYVSDVKNQGYCGCCWAFSAVAGLESATMIANKSPNTNLDLSEQVLVSCCDTTCSPNGPCSGGYPAVAADFLRDKGAPVESCYPYQGWVGCGNACANWQASAYKIKSWDWVVVYGDTPSVDKIKEGIVKYGPLPITMAVYSDFCYYTSGVYTHAWGGLYGYHAMLVVGYDDGGQYFIVKNSWDTTWGEKGYIRVAYSEVAGDSKLGYMTFAYHVGDNPNPTCMYSIGDYFTASGGTGSIQGVGG